MSYPNYGDNAYGNQYGNQGGGFGGPGPAPDNNMAWAILSTVLCCLPLGIVSVVKASNVNTLWAQGQYAAAQQAAEDAKKFAMWSAIASFVSWVIIIIIYVLIFAAAASSYGY